MLLNNLQTSFMIKKNTFFFGLILILTGCSMSNPSTFSEKAQNESFLDLNHTSVFFKDILSKNKGHKILINVWASWCSDCVAGFPNLKEFQKNNPKVKPVFLSIDRSVFRWKKAIDKYNIEGEHYFIKNGLNGDFGDFLNSNWTPRYMVVNEKGVIELFKAKKITDKRIVEALKK